MQGPSEVMDYTGWWCETCGLTKTNHKGYCRTCEGEVDIVDTVILTKRLYKDAWELIIKQMFEAIREEYNNE